MASGTLGTNQIRGRWRKSGEQRGGADDDDRHAGLQTRDRKAAAPGESGEREHHEHARGLEDQDQTVSRRPQVTQSGQLLSRTQYSRQRRDAECDERDTREALEERPTLLPAPAAGRLQARESEDPARPHSGGQDMERVGKLGPRGRYDPRRVTRRG